MNFKIISNLKEAEEAWKLLSPNEVLYDDWNFRFLYYKYFNYPLYFYAAYDKDELVALLPLMLNTDKNLLDFFAGFEYMEDNRVFTKKGYENLAQELINMIDIPARLDYMNESMSPLLGSQIHDYNYFIILNEMNSYQDFMTKYLSKDSNRNLSSQIKRILDSGEIKITRSNLNDLNIMEKFNRDRFGDHSSYAERPHWNDFFKSIGANFDSEIITISIDNKIVGVGFSLYFNNICYGINAGFDTNISNLGKYITLLKIDAAIKRGCKIYDAGGSGAFGWKEDFHLNKRPFYCLELK